MHSKTEAQELQAISKAVKKQQTEQKKKVGYFLTAKSYFFSVVCNVAANVIPWTNVHRLRFFFPSKCFFCVPKIAC